MLLCRGMITGFTYEVLSNIKEFLDKLESEGKEDWQIRQAYKAVKVFLEDFMCLLIDFTEDSENGSTCKPVKKPKT